MKKHTGGRLDGRSCPGCGGKKSESWRLCRACFEKYGRQAEGWPGWLRDLVEDNRRIRHDAKRRAERELSLDVFRELLESAEHDGQKRFIDHLITGGELALSKRPKGDPWWPGTDEGWTLLLPWAPYEQESVNEQYRQSNGIIGQIEAADYVDSLTTALGLVTPDPEDDLADAEHFEAVTKEAQAALTERQQEVLALYLDNGNQEAVAQELGVSQSTVSRHWRAILEKFEEIAKRYA